MSVPNSLATGLRRVLRSPGLILAVYLINVVVAMPLAVSMRGILKESIGSSLVDEKLTQGFDLTWYGEFSQQSSGLAQSFEPSVVGILPMLANLEKLLDGEILKTQSTLLLAGIVFLLVWAFLMGGMIDRYAQADGRSPRSQFFSQCGAYFFRMVRLQILALLIYWVVFRWVANPLHEWVTESMRDVTAETTVMRYTFLVYATVALFLLLLSITLDYAKIALVTEKRRSSLLAFAHALRFVLSHPGKTFGLYLLLLAVGGVLLLIYGFLAPGPNQSTWTSVGLAFLAGQGYLLARLALKLWFLASQTRMFQLVGSSPGH